MRSKFYLIKYIVYGGVLLASIFFFAPRLPKSSLTSQDFYQPIEEQNTPLKFIFDFGLYVWALHKTAPDKALLSYNEFSPIVNVVLEQKSRFPSLYLMLSNQLIYDYKKPIEASALLKEAEIIFPQNKEIHLTLGYIYRFVLNDPEKAKQHELLWGAREAE